MAAIETKGIRLSKERARGCGFRKPGGIYLVSGGVGVPCDRLPQELDVCPACGGGVKPSRGWTWIDGDVILAKPCRSAFGSCATCYLCGPVRRGEKIGRVGLLWIGGSYYATPGDWMREAEELGVSRRIPAVPKDFKAGETIVLVAHRQAVLAGVDPATGAQILKPAIFHAFIPRAVEYVVKGDETAEELAAIEKRGIELVKVERIGETGELGAELGEEAGEVELG